MGHKHHANRSKPMLNTPLPMIVHMMLLLNRVALGGYLLLAGWAKVVPEWRHGAGTYLYSDAFHAANVPWLPATAATSYGYGLPWMELVSGAMLMLGLGGRLSAALVMGMTLLMSLSLMSVGQALPAHAALVMFTLAATLTVLGVGRYSLDAGVAAWRRFAARHGRAQAAPTAA